MGRLADCFWGGKLNFSKHPLVLLIFFFFFTNGLFKEIDLDSKNSWYDYVQVSRLYVAHHFDRNVKFQGFTREK